MNIIDAGSVESKAAAGERAIAIRDTLDIASFPGHGNEATLKAQALGVCVRASSLATSLHPPTMTSHVGSGVNRNYSEFLFHVAALKHTNERSCITASFSKKSKPSETNDPQCMTTSHCFGLSRS